MKLLLKILFTTCFVTVIVAIFCISTIIYQKSTPEFACGVSNETDNCYCGTIDEDRNNNYTGSVLFKQNCTSCHALNEVVVGPALNNVGSKRSKEWMHAIISNADSLIKSGDTTAIRLYNDYDKITMTSFNELTIAEINSIIDYLR